MSLRPSWLAVVVAVAGTVSAARGEPRPGDVWTGPPRELGPSSGVLRSGTRELHRWPDRVILVENGRVARVTRIDVEAEAAAESRRAAERAAAEQAAERREAAERAARLRENERAEIRREEAERARAEQEAELARLEREKIEQVQALAEAEERLARERAARLTSLEKELSVLRLALKRARELEDAENVRRLSAALRAKAAEYDLLRAGRAR